MQTFYMVTGLKVNSAKTSLYCSRSVHDSVKMEMKDLTGYTLGALPVTYLGIPLITRKLKAIDCNKLVNRIKG
ncbi:hypothetical protein LINPERPRIM_LOCUS40729 [Linum perenne]